MLRRSLFKAMILALCLSAVPGSAYPNPEASSPRLQIDLDADGSRYVRIALWTQIWVRAQQHNPGSMVRGQPRDWTADIAIRRARVLIRAKPLENVMMVLHIGANNMSFVSPRPMTLFVHDAYAVFEAYKNYLHVGAGLHYWNGISRATSASTISALTIDLPVVNWPMIGRGDQAARQLGLFVKGQLSRFDYRLALNRPFAPTTTLEPGGAVDYHSSGGDLALTGYVKWMFWDKEQISSHAQAGTYLGAKSVFNLGAGYYWHPRAMGRADAASEETRFDALNLGVDLFCDKPLFAASALTTYLVYYYYRMGPDFVRSSGTLNIAEGGSTFNGPGNAYPVIGTGHHLYGQLGYLTPWRALNLGVQPYVAAQASFMEGLADPSLILEAGVNWLVWKHHFKVTTHYRNRPVFETANPKPRATLRRNELTTQVQAYF